MWTAADVSGAASVKSDHAEQGTAADGDDEDRERVDAELRAHHERLDQLLEHAVSNRATIPMMIAAVVPSVSFLAAFRGVFSGSDLQAGVEAAVEELKALQPQCAPALTQG